MVMTFSNKERQINGSINIEEALVTEYDLKFTQW